jgi:hypothetical protein
MTQTLERNWAFGLHSRWERELHKEFAAAKSEGRLVTLDERKAIVDAAVRFHKNKAEDVVNCEFCQEEIAQCILEKRDFFEPPLGVREYLESYGIVAPRGRKLPYKAIVPRVPE